MRCVGIFLPWVALSLVACQGRPAPHSGTVPLDSARAAAITDSVRIFAESVAIGVTTKGPDAWRTYFADEPTFFMASEGRLAFPNSDSAGRAIRSLAQIIAHIDLRWGDSLRIDPLAPGLAVLATPYHETRVDARGHQVEEDGFLTGIVEHRGARWQFRNAHWSVVTPPAVVP